jgi:hypothetical protein
MIIYHKKTSRIKLITLVIKFKKKAVKNNNLIYVVFICAETSKWKSKA